FSVLRTPVIPAENTLGGGVISADNMRGVITRDNISQGLVHQFIMVHLPSAIGSRGSVASQQSALLYPADSPRNVVALDPGDLGDASHAWEGSAGLVGVQADGIQYRPVGLAQFRARRLGRDPREVRVDGCHGQCSWR